jgi:hypothetical protein
MNAKITLGEAAATLKANGYEPRALTGDDSYRYADDLAVVVCTPKAGGNIGLLTVCVKDKATRAEVFALLARHGAGKKSPVRTDSAGNESHVIALAVYGGLGSRQSKPFATENFPVLAFDCYERVGFNVVPAVVRVDGNWRNGSLLETPRDALPSLDEMAIDAIFKAVDALTFKDAPAYAPPPARPLTPAQKAARVERERLELEISKRTDKSIWAEVSKRLQSAAGIGMSAWERAAAQQHSESPTVRIAAYDTVVAERAADAARKARLAKNAAQLNSTLNS